MEKINIAEILKDCPSGMELDCTMYEDVYFDYVDELQIIHCYIQRELCKTSITFNQYGTPNSDIKSKCVIFPKDKTTWKGFQRLFKDGDIVCNIENAIIIYKKISTKGYCGSFASLDRNNVFIPHYLAYLEDTCRFATEDEKQKLFDAIKTSGYKWNSELKTLEELIPNKFDITTFKPFDKVLVRCSELEIWHISFFEKYNRQYSKYPFVCLNGNKYSQCIPYKDNEHLLDTAVNCNDYYKTW